MSYVARSMIEAEHETLMNLVRALSCLSEGAGSMSRYQSLAYLTEVATEIALAKKTSADDVFKTLAALPRDKVTEVVKKMM
jgi:hypothetical protein